MCNVFTNYNITRTYQFILSQHNIIHAHRERTIFIRSIAYLSLYRFSNFKNDNDGLYARRKCGVASAEMKMALNEKYHESSINPRVRASYFVSRESLESFETILHLFCYVI